MLQDDIKYFIKCDTESEEYQKYYDAFINNVAINNYFVVGVTLIFDGKLYAEIALIKGGKNEN